MRPYSGMGPDQVCVSAPSVPCGMIALSTRWSPLAMMYLAAYPLPPAIIHTGSGALAPLRWSDSLRTMAEMSCSKPPFCAGLIGKQVHSNGVAVLELSCGKNERRDVLGERPFPERRVDGQW